jgi:hypothetical protein
MHGNSKIVKLLVESIFSELTGSPAGRTYAVHGILDELDVVQA